MEEPIVAHVEPGRATLIPPASELRRHLVFRHGAASNSFLTLYDGYRDFLATTREPGLIPYVETRGAFVGAAEPLAGAGTDERRLLAEFARAAVGQGKVALLLPVSERVRRVAQSLGYGALPVGSEPLFHLDRYDPIAARPEAARRLAARGARVTSFTPAALEPDERGALDALVEAWLRSRRHAELHSLNRVRPWSLAADKRYFRLEYPRGTTLAFLSAVPIPAPGGWYLVDIFRAPGVVAGASELLILETMRQLRDEGATLASLGIAPLAPGEPGTPVLYPWWLGALYEHGDFFYRFRSLYEFKRKLRPTGAATAHLLHYPARLGPRHGAAAFEFFLGPPHRALADAVAHRWRNRRAPPGDPGPLRRRLPRAPSGRWPRRLRRLPLSLTIAAGALFAPALGAPVASAAILGAAALALAAVEDAGGSRYALAALVVPAALALYGSPSMAMASVLALFGAAGAMASISGKKRWWVPAMLVGPACPWALAGSLAAGLLSRLLLGAGVSGGWKLRRCWR